MAHEGQQHPIAIYFWVWALLFVVSGASYMVDYLKLQGMLRWSLIVIFMLIKAGFVVAIFMHMKWERLALKLAILVPPVAIVILMWLMSLEGDYTFLTRTEFFGDSDIVTNGAPHHQPAGGN